MIESRLAPARGKTSAANGAEPREEHIRLMLVHPLLLFRTSLARLLAAEPDFELAAECANTAEAMENMERTRPDVVLFDFALWRDFISVASEGGYRGKLL